MIEIVLKCPKCGEETTIADLIRNLLEALKE
mgnify:FL=1